MVSDDDRRTYLGIKIGVDLVEEIEWSGVALLDSKHYRRLVSTTALHLSCWSSQFLTCCQSYQRLLSTRKLLDSQTFIDLRVE